MTTTMTMTASVTKTLFTCTYRLIGLKRQGTETWMKFAIFYAIPQALFLFPYTPAFYQCINVDPHDQSLPNDIKYEMNGVLGHNSVR